jgi:hypothetical protein
MRLLLVDFVVVRPVTAVPDRVGPAGEPPRTSMMGGESNREYLL